jgi:hypothetical protein
MKKRKTRKTKNVFDAPSPIKVGYADFDIKTFKEKRSDNPERLSGATFPQWHYIKLNEEHNYCETVSTLLHELGHAACYVFGITFKSEAEEEKYVAAFANGYATIFKDNLKLLDWIKESLLLGNKKVTEKVVSKKKKRK